MTSRKLRVLLLACLPGLFLTGASAALDVAAEPTDKAALSWATDALPSCLAVAGDKEMCSWHTRDGENMICVFGPTGQPLIDFPCMVTRDNTDMATWPDDAQRWGDEALDTMWHEAANLPTINELTDPVGWAARVLL